VCASRRSELAQISLELQQQAWERVSPQNRPRLEALSSEALIYRHRDRARLSKWITFVDQLPEELLGKWAVVSLLSMSEALQVAPSDSERSDAEALSPEGCAAVRSLQALAMKEKTTRPIGVWFALQGPSSSEYPELVVADQPMTLKVLARSGARRNSIVWVAPEPDSANQ
jgi:hypothetical protein